MYWNNYYGWISLNEIYKKEIEQQQCDIKTQLFNNMRICETINQLDDSIYDIQQNKFYNQIDCTPIISTTEIQPFICIYKSKPITKYNIQLELWGRNPNYKII